MDMRFVLIGLLLLASASAASAESGSPADAVHDALLETAIARPALPPGNATGWIETRRTLTGGSEPEVKTSRANPSKEPAKAFASYSELKDIIGPDAHVIERVGSRTTYAFTTRHIPKSPTQVGDVKVSMDGRVEDALFDGMAVVLTDATGQPYVGQLDLRMRKAAGNWFVRVKHIDISYKFGPAAPGTAIAANAMSVDVDVRAALFVHRAVHTDSMLVASSETP